MGGVVFGLTPAPSPPRKEEEAETTRRNQRPRVTLRDSLIDEWIRSIRARIVLPCERKIELFLLLCTIRVSVSR